MAESPFLEMSRSTPTVLWNDSPVPAELTAAIGWGAVGATCNPVIALSALKADREHWAARIREYLATHPTATEDEIGWAMVRELSIAAARLLEPAFDQHHGRNGRLSIQTDPRNHRNARALADQAVEFAGLARNVIVKIPATSAGIVAIEDAVYRGVSINATVSFSTAQTIAVAEAIEAGLRRREAEGLDLADMGHVCTIMVGRTDDWLKQVITAKGLDIDPAVCDWAGVAVFKNAYRIYQERGYRTRLLSAAFRNHHHWSQLIGGDVVISPPFGWQEKANDSGISGEARMHLPVDAGIMAELERIGAEFHMVYDERGMSIVEFDSYGATLRTLRQFLQANNDLEQFVRDITVPDPD